MCVQQKLLTVAKERVNSNVVVRRLSLCSLSLPHAVSHTLISNIRTLIVIYVSINQALSSSV